MTTLYFQVSSINRVLRNLASKSFDSASSASSSTGISTSNTNGSNANVSQDNVYDKLRLLNSGQAWPTHPSAWYVPSPTSAAAAAATLGAAFHHMNGQGSPNSHYNALGHLDSLGGDGHHHHHLHGHHANGGDLNDCKKGKCSFFFSIFTRNFWSARQVVSESAWR